jgi:ribonuclease HI
VAYTDGSCLNNGQTSALGGYSVVFVENPGAYFAWNMDDGLVPTNNRAEFYGWLAALVWRTSWTWWRMQRDAPRPATYLVIHADSTYVVDTVNTWLWDGPRTIM